MAVTTEQAVVHCAICSEYFYTRNPQGQIVLSRVPELGMDMTIYHLTRPDPDYSRTICGLDGGEFDSRIGTVGVEMWDDELTHEWLRGLSACTACFRFVRMVA